MPDWDRADGVLMTELSGHHAEIYQPHYKMPRGRQYIWKVFRISDGHCCANGTAGRVLDAKRIAEAVIRARVGE